MKQRIEDKERYWKERRELKLKHDKEWQEKREREHAEDRLRNDQNYHRDEQCPAPTTSTSACDANNISIKKVTSYHYDFTEKQCVPYHQRSELKCASAGSEVDE
jgi:hypothetical protein